MSNVDKIFELIMNTDESLSGSCWEDLHYSYLDTPKDVIDNVIETYMNNEIFGMEDVTETDKKLALAKYFHYLADDLNAKPDDINMQTENSAIISCLPYLPFDIKTLETNNSDKYLIYTMTISTTYGEDNISIGFSKDTIIEYKQKGHPVDCRYRYLCMIAKAIEETYDKDLENLLEGDDEEAIRTAIVIHSRISLLIEQLDNGEFIIK